MHRFEQISWSFSARSGYPRPFFVWWRRLRAMNFPKFPTPYKLFISEIFEVVIFSVKNFGDGDYKIWYMCLCNFELGWIRAKNENLAEISELKFSCAKKAPFNAILSHFKNEKIENFRNFELTARTERNHSWWFFESLWCHAVRRGFIS